MNYVKATFNIYVCVGVCAFVRVFTLFTKHFFVPSFVQHTFVKNRPTINEVSTVEREQ